MNQRQPVTLEEFERVVDVLDWDAATDTERRTLLDEFVARLAVYPDHLEVEIRGAGKLNVALHEVGLRNRPVETAGVGGASTTLDPRHRSGWVTLPDAA